MIADMKLHIFSVCSSDACGHLTYIQTTPLRQERENNVLQTFSFYSCVMCVYNIQILKE